MKYSYRKYAQDVATGKIVSGQLVHLACERFLNDLDRADLEFRDSEAQRAIEFISLLKHFKGTVAGQNYVMEPWQQFLVANIVGWYWRGTDTRRFTTSYIQVSRKSAKTICAAAMCMYFLLADGEAGAEVDLCANSKQQALIAYEFCSVFARQLDPKQKLLVPYRDRINLDETNSKLNVFAADDTKLDGYNASFALIDEYHAAPNSKIRDVLKSSMGQRKNPHLCTITTAGFNLDGPCYKLRCTGEDILRGYKDDDSFFILIYEMDKDDDWTNPEVWPKAAPMLGVTVSEKYLKEQVTSAINNSSEQVGVRTKNLNEWLQSSEIWITEPELDKIMQPIDLQDFKDEICYMGVDLAAVSDFTAVAYMIPKQVDDTLKYYFKVDYYLPNDTVYSHKNSILYREWVRQGYLNKTEGNVTDYTQITKDIVKYNDTLDIMSVSYDAWNSTQWAIEATNEGLPLQKYAQNMGAFNKPTKELERLIKQGRIIIDDNPITRFCFRNVLLRVDLNGNIKPSKEKPDNKIDGVIAIIECLGSYLESPHYAGDITVI